MKIEDMSAFIVYPYNTDRYGIRTGYIVQVGDSAIEIDSIADIDYLMNRLSDMRKDWIEEISINERKGQM